MSPARANAESCHHIDHHEAGQVTAEAVLASTSELYGALSLDPGLRATQHG